MVAVIKQAVRSVLGPPSMDESRLAYQLLKRRVPGVLLEVGAHHGDDTLQRFAADGWDVHAFEPDPANRLQLDKVASRFSNIAVVPCAVSDAPGTMTLYRSPESTGVSSLAPFTASHVPVGEVDVIRLSDYLSAPGTPENVTLLKVDVEGYERFVLEGFPWATHRPETVLLEFEDNKTEPLGYNWRDLADFLVDRDYNVLVSEWFPIERYGAAHRWRRFARYPVELEHPRAWGNLIGTTGDLAKLERIAKRARRRLAASTPLYRLAGR